MSVTLTAKTNLMQQEVSSQEWRAITEMACGFRILDKPWSGYCNNDEAYTPEELKQMADRCRQIGEAAEYLDALAENGGARLS